MSSHPTALIAGGAGYIGSHACKALAAAGFLPVVYDNLSAGHHDFVRWGPLVEGDLLDANTLIETIVHTTHAWLARREGCLPAEAKGESRRAALPARVKSVR